MSKALCIIAIVVSALLVLVFGLDMIIGIPFGKSSIIMDIGFVVFSLILGFLSLTTLREQR
jgi:hypothetical protein